MRPFGFDVPVVMGHRGAPRLAPENTPASFAAAARVGATWVELDVRRSADGLVVAHDPVLRDGTPLLSASTADLCSAGVFGLDEVLEMLPDGLGVDVELKNYPGDPDYDETDALVPAAAPAILAAAAARPLMVSSFNPSPLAALTPLAPGVPLGLLHNSTLGASAALALARELDAAVLCSPDDAPGLDPDLVAAAHAAGLAVLVWTVDDPTRARHLAAMGVDAICTNDPAGLAPTLRRNYS